MYQIITNCLDAKLLSLKTNLLSVTQNGQSIHWPPVIYFLVAFPSNLLLIKKFNT